MSPNTPRDQLLARYEEAKALVPDGLPEAPSAATRERIMQAAREQVNAMNSIAYRADSMPANDQKGLENSVETQIATVEAANDSFWGIKAVASLAIMGLSALLWWQFEHGTPEEQQAAKSAQPTAAAPADLPLTDPASATTPVPVPAAAPAAEAAPAPADKPVAAAQPRVAATPQAPAAKLEEAAKPSLADAAFSKPSVPSVSTAQEAPATPAASTQATQNAERARVAEAPRAEPSAAAAPSSPPAPAAVAPMMRSAPSAAASPPAADIASHAAPTAQTILLPVTPLFTAIDQRNAQALRQALSQSISLNARNADGNPALTQAVIQRWAEGVRMLLAAGADKSAKNNKGHTASDVALELGYDDMTELLAMPR
jgi:cytoskeletal protein RodZ